jgi:RNA polymerase sigma-70 factor (ECF subfamily)
MVALLAPVTDTHASFERYVVPELEVLYRTARSLTRSDADAQDLVQDTLLRAYRAIDRFDGRYPRAWLLTIMRNANINRARKKKPDLLDDPDATFERTVAFAENEGPEELALEDELDATIEEGFRRLPENFREVVELVDLNGLAYQEAANLLDIPVGTVMSRLHRARKRIREHIETVGLDVTNVDLDTGDASSRDDANGGPRTGGTSR